MSNVRRLVISAFLLSWGILFSLPAAAQYFGRNKVQYDEFDFKVLETDHFEVFYYPEEQQAAHDLARMAERWYRRHSRTYLREFKEKKALIIYANDADFHQTNVIGGMVGEGTGGVTESVKQRVVMPLTGSYAETNHVLGHELTHSFQYDIAFGDTTRFNLQMPLWLIEGTAEYLSVGRVDPHTALWLRDAALRDDMPSAEDLTRDPQKYFPYRYGEAFMAYIGGKYGDAAVANLYKLAGRAGVDSAFVYALGIKADSLSKEWGQAVKDTYLPLTEGRTPADDAGRLVLAESIDAGEMNLAPAVSPDGRYVAFISELDLFNINLFIADAETGEVIKKLKGAASNAHFDNLRFINSAGSWSPDGKKLAFVTFAKGDNEIAILDVDSRNVERNIKVKGVTAITNLAWSPDGASIAFSGMDGGISDLYVMDLASRNVRQFTNDRYADLQPTWSPDGSTIAFTTDRGPGGTDFEKMEFAPMRLATLDVASGQIETHVPFPGALHHNPQYSPDGRNLFFISDQDGFKDIYRLALDTGAVTRVTHLQTGVTGITAMSPAMSVALQSGRMMFSVYADNKYSVYSLEPDETAGEPVTQTEGVSNAAILPPVFALHDGLVSNYLSDPETGLPPPDRQYASHDYKSKLQLDYVAPPSVGVGVGGPFGTQVGGGVGFFFSDMLGNQNLVITAQANGTIKDIGGQVTYFNQGHRINYGATGGHIPVLFGGAISGYDPNTGIQVVEQLRQRVFIDQLAGFASYPLTTTRRAEVGLGFVRYGFDFEIDRYIIQPNGLIDRERVGADEGILFGSLKEPNAFYFFNASTAFVGDHSFFGFTSPVRGARYRFQIAPQIGTDAYATLLLDYRKYFDLRPFTFAIRGLHVGNYGAAAGDLFSTEYLGSSYRQGFVRGYGFNSFDATECTPGNATTAQFSQCSDFNRLAGTRIAVASAELRIPLFGTRQFGLINFPYLPTELSLFTDAGLAWTAEDPPDFAFVTDQQELADRAAAGHDRIPVVSSGISARFNVLGYLVFEVFYAVPYQRPSHKGLFGFQLQPGW